MSVPGHWWQKTTEEIYAYRTQKPSAPVGLPIIGRHWAYVGRTTSGRRRDREHLVGGGRYGAVAKDWADLRPRRYVLFRRKRRTRAMTHFLEWVMIHILLPVYNDRMNRTNPRRITQAQARRQRAHRDRYGAGARLAPALLRTAVVAGSLLLAFQLAPVLLHQM